MGFLSRIGFGVDRVVIVHEAGLPTETRVEAEAQVQPQMGFFEVDAPIYEGDIVEAPDPRGGIERKHVTEVDWLKAGTELDHIEAHWTVAPLPRRAAVDRVKPQTLQELISDAAGDLYTDGHYSESVFEAFTAVEVRVRTMSGLTKSGRDLMANAFGGNAPPISLTQLSGQSGMDEQEGGD